MFLAIGLVAGAMGGLFGIGGGIVIVPALALLLGFAQKKAQGTSLVALVAPVGILGLVTYYKAGNVDLKAGAWIAGGFVLGSLAGAVLANQLGNDLMKRMFGAFLVIVGLYIFFTAGQPPVRHLPN